MSTLTAYEQSQIYKHQLEAWHLFYESFTESAMSCDLIRAILVDMQSELIKYKIKFPEKDTKKQQSRIDSMHRAVDFLEKLNNRCMSLQKSLKDKTQECLSLQERIDKYNEQIDLASKI